MTYVLIHGGGATARFWDRVVPRLRGDHAADHHALRVLAVNLPGRADRPGDLATLTVDDEVTSVVADIEDASLETEIVLVAHSSGGLVVPGVVRALHGRVRHIVLSAALIPPEGGRGIDCMQERHRAGLLGAFEASQQDGNPIILPRPADSEMFRTTYGGDPLNDETLAFVSDPARSVPDTVHHYFQPVRWSQVHATPVTYVLNERDRPIPTPLQEEMITRLPHAPTVIRLDGGHIPAVTDPPTFVAILTGIQRDMAIGAGEA